MKNQRIATVLLLTACVMCLGQATSNSPPATHPKVIVGKETTLVDGPLNADGTVNFVPALNALIGKGVTNENNAAPLLLSISMGKGKTPRDTAVFREWRLPSPDPNGPELDYFEGHKQKKLGNVAIPLLPEEQDRLSNIVKACEERPWKAVDHPDVAEWLKDNQAALAIVEKACERTRFFIPFVSEKTPPELLDGLPSLGHFFLASHILARRAMLHMGDGNLEAAFADLKRIRILGRFAEQGHMDLTHLIGLACELVALRGYAGLTDGLQAADLAKVRKEIESMETFPSMDDTRSLAEEMLVLDMLMACVRGEAGKIVRLIASVYDETKPLNLGDIDRVDWNAAMNEVVRAYDQERKIVDKPFGMRIKELEERANAARAEKYPDSYAEDEGNPLAGVRGVESFLKMREGESRDAYSRRMGRWFAGLNSEFQRRLVLLNQRERTLRDIALLSVSLAEFQVSHGNFPEALQELGTTAVQDAYSGKDVLYKKQGGGYVLWSVGMNQKDDGATKDDLVFKRGNTP